MSDTFEALRPRLMRIAYRMTGSVTDAEDVTQEAALRWHRADRKDIAAPEAFLRRVVIRLCLDLMGSAQRRREVYPGPWLPEPVISREPDSLDITLPLMMALERLSPLERAAFLLHDVFGLGFAEIAETIGRDESACRQLAHRARGHIRASRPRFAVNRDQGQRLAEAFFEASRSGDMQRLRTLLAEEVVAWSDGGGKVPASAYPLNGIEAVMNRHEALAEAFAQSPSRLVCYAFVNGLPGFVTLEAGAVFQTTALQCGAGKITDIYVVRNPDKLRHIQHDSY